MIRVSSNERDAMRICCLVLIIVSSAVCTRAQDLPPAFLKSLPREKVDEQGLTRLIVERLTAVDNLTERAILLNSVGGLLPFGPELDKRVKEVLEKTIDEVGKDQRYPFGRVGAHFPSLHAKLLGRIDDARMRDKIRSVFARHCKDLTLARQICAKIDAPELRRTTISYLVYRARSLEEMLEMLEESISLLGDASTYGGLMLLRKYAADKPKVICDFVERNVSADNAMYPYTVFAYEANRENPAAAKVFMDAAWSRLPDTTKPFEHAASLLKRDYREVDRETWVSKFDEHVLPALRDAKTGIGPLSELARFDVDLMIDGTRKSCVHPARPFERIFPQVLSRAFFVNPDAVLAWLETTDSNLKHVCVLQVVARLSSWDEPPSKLQAQRVCDLALVVEEPQQRLTALAKLATILPSYKIDVPDKIAEQGRELFDRHVALESIELPDYDRRELLSLTTLVQRKQYIEIQIKKLRAATDYQEQLGFSGLAEYILKSGLTSMEQMILIRRIAKVAEGHSSTYLQTKIANAAVKIDAKWAIKTIWSILPEDRGRSGKRKYIDWIGPPSDAGDAVRWLNQELKDPTLKINLMVALWEFLPTAPPIDQDSLRKELCQLLNTYRQYEAVLGLAKQIESPTVQTEVLLNLVSGLRLNQKSTQP